VTKQSAHKHCDFCNKSKEDVEKLITSENSAICNSCIDLCVSILAEEKVRKFPNDHKKLNPSTVKDYLDDYVIGQDDAKIAICVAVAQHFKRIYNPNKDIQIEKTNVLLLGPTGCGKTMIARKIAEYLDLPFVICDATGITEAGYVGDDVESILLRLINASDGDLVKASKGIVYIDEVDKIGRKGSGTSITRDVSGEGVQQALLKMVEGTVMRVPNTGKRKHPGSDMLELDTRDILFICGGAFVGLENIIKDRQNKKTIGFQAPAKAQAGSADQDKTVMPKDIIQFGFIPEFVGRFGVITSVEELSVEHLIRILIEPKNSIIRQYQYIFELDGIELTFEDDAVAYIAEQAKELKTNARGLKNIIERILLPYQFDAQNLVARGLSKISINRNTVMGSPAVMVFDNKVKNEQK
jgi:ATP-dependent Clp protease ATP-binding subunit ClpX